MAAAAASLDSAREASAILARLVESARQMVPTLLERAPDAEQLRRIPDQTIRDFTAAGLFRIFLPRRFGGYELDYGAPQVAIAAELGRGCGSSAWIATVTACHSWIIGMYPLQAQQDVWGDAPDTLSASALVPEKSRLERVAGGYRLSGRWKFSSGVDAAEWNLIVAPLDDGAGTRENVLCLVPKRDYRIIDTWFVGGLRATGSKDVEVADAFVPDHRIVPLRMLKGGATPGSAANPSHIYRLPLYAVFPYNIAAPAIGIARGVIEQFTARARTQVSPNGQRPAESLAMQLRVAEAAVTVDAVSELILRDAEEINRVGRAGETFDYEKRTRYRRDLAYAALSCMRAVDVIHQASGAHGLFEEFPIQRAFRDVHAINAHAALRWDSNGLQSGRLALGLDCSDPTY
ncbi:MAG TPA: acyl-CoA dehydrogenase family protein [Candidatus Binataceae bacterium]|nr:acyl-CoA dehydrogenase family protein [Candidatus Binataceae bacterium]